MEMMEKKKKEQKNRAMNENKDIAKMKQEEREKR